ncbi:hypothetical protein J6590_102718, partial [Homalodisca vitripennis]
TTPALCLRLTSSGLDHIEKSSHGTLLESMSSNPAINRYRLPYYNKLRNHSLTVNLTLPLTDAVWDIFRIYTFTGTTSNIFT